MMKAYGGGFRAGMANPTFKTNANGTRSIADPVCPYSKRQFISRFLWNFGAFDGLAKRVMAYNTGAGAAATLILSKQFINQVFAAKTVMIDGRKVDAKKVTYASVCFARRIKIDGKKVTKRFEGQ